MSTSTATATPTPPIESFAALFEESIAKQEMRSGEVITAEVVGIDNNRQCRPQVRELDPHRGIQERPWRT